jgi:hypothetical protein
VGESGVLFHVGVRMTNNYSIDGVKLGGLYGMLVGKSSYRANVNHRLPYGILYLDDASLSSMYLELMY